ncbi:MAG: DUF2142 domain-containing protein [Promicromonosporaceae bacterium]|nr:DUF2142 domain-containing protein [Promicromonosporaceae bacterium]
MTLLDTLPGSPRWVRWIAEGRRVSPRRSFWATFAALFVVSSIWAIANPLMASVDEPAHVVKAAATVKLADDISADGYHTGIGTVMLPGLYEQLALFPNCFAFQPDVTAACQPALSGDLDALRPVQTSAINYNPMYYAVVGLPALLPGGGEHTVYLMRLVNAAFAAAVLAMAARTVVELRRRRWVGIGLVLSLTPTIVNLLGSVNPQSVEVAGIALLWVALLALLREPDPALTVRRLVRVVLGALLVANARGLGPFFVTLVVLICLVAVPWRKVTAMFTDRRLWWGVGGGVLACVIGTLWILKGSALPQGAAGAMGWREAVLFSIGHTSAYIQQLISALGWLDVAVPIWVYLAASALIGFVAILAWSIGRGRDRLVLLGTAALVLLMPVAIQGMQAQALGPFWQGRYVYPLAIGFVLLAGVAIDDRADLLPGWLHANLATTLGLSFAAVNVAAFATNLHRYVNGATGGWFRLDAHSWNPPLNPLLLVLLYALAWLAFVGVVLRVTSDGEDRRITV